MRKVSLIVLFVALFIVLIKFYFSSYEIEYELDGFSVLEKYENREFYFEVSDGEVVYNFKLFNEKRSLGKKVIDSISVISSEDYSCVYAEGGSLEFYPVCSDKEGNLVSYHLIKDAEIVSFVRELDIEYDKKVIDESKEFQFFDNVDEEDVIAIWKYNGFYIIDKDGVQDLELFKKDRYSNDLTVLYKDRMLLPNYDEDLVFSSFILFDITNKNSLETIETDFEISYDAYIAGTFNNDIYLFDNKNMVLYSINVKNGKVKVVGNEEEGFIKIENYKKVDASVEEYKKERITYFAESSVNSLVVNGNYKSYEENESVSSKFIDSSEFSVVHVYKDKIYYIKNDNLYMYSSKYGEKVLLHYFELNFNDKNRIFIYNKW